MKAAKNAARGALITDPAWMEPMLGPDGQREIDDAAFGLIASSLAGQIKPIARSYWPLNVNPPSHRALISRLLV